MLWHFLFCPNSLFFPPSSQAKGLEDQLLGVVVVKERPELEQQKNALVVANASMSKELKKIEDQILKLLAESQGNILDDTKLIETLAVSKATSEEILKAVAEAETGAHVSSRVSLSVSAG